MSEPGEHSHEQRPRTAPRSRAEQQAETRDKLLDSALEIFIERGFHGASVDAIARHAGYTKGAVYANFADKAELFLAVVDRRIDEGVSNLEEAKDIAHTGRLPDDEIRSRIHDRFQIRWALLGFETILYAIRERPELVAELAKRYRHIDQVTTAFLREKGADPPEAIDYLAIAQSALGEGLMLRHIVEPERISHEVIERTFDAVFDPAHREAWKASGG